MRASHSQPPAEPPVLATYVETTPAVPLASDDVQRCDVCEELIIGEPAGYGVYLWTRGDETREERVPLCESCSTAIGLSAATMLEIEEEDG